MTMSTMLLTDDLRFRPAMQLMENAEYSEALSQLDLLLEQLSPHDRLVGLYWKVSCLTWLGEVMQARMCLDEALAKVDVGNPLAICLKLQSAFLLRVEETPEKAALELRSLLDRYAEEMRSKDFFWIYVQAKTQLGSCLALAGHYSEATKELEEALLLETQPLARYFIQFWLGDAYYQLGELERAREHLESTATETQSAPKAGVPTYYAARVPYELALIAYKQRRFADAERRLELASNVGASDRELLRAVERLREVMKHSKQD